MQTKVCTKCGQGKPLDEFYPRRDRGAGALKQPCKSCCQIRFKNYHEQNKDSRRLYNKKWRNENRELSRSLTINWRSRNKDKVKATEKKSHKKASEECRDFYVVNQLLHKGFSPEQITPDLIKAQRALIKVKRAVKEIA